MSTLTFDWKLNDGTGNNYVEQTKIERNGVFKGWKATSGYSDTTTIFTSGNLDPKKITSDAVTLTAQWEGVSDTGAVVIGEKGAYPVTTPTRLGYHFDGWFTEPTGGTQIFDTTEVSESATYYAHWTPATYNVVVDPANGTLASAPTLDDVAQQDDGTYTGKKTFADATDSAYDTAGFTVPNPQHPKGFSFTGWNITGMTSHVADPAPDPAVHELGDARTNDPTATGVKATTFKNLSADANYTPTLTATYDVQTYHVKVDPNQGTWGDGAVASEKATLDDATFDGTSIAGTKKGNQWISVTPPTRYGYTFDGWDVSGMDEVTGLAEGVNAHNIGTTGTNATTFVATKDQNSFMDLIVTQAAADASATTPVTIKARWVPNPVTLTLKVDHNDQGTAGTQAVYYTFDSQSEEYFSDSAHAAALAGNKIVAPTRVGYVFGGYFTEQDGGGTQYIDETGAIVGTPYKAVGENCDLYAKWTPGMYQVTLDFAEADKAYTHTDADPTSFYAHYRDDYYKTDDATGDKFTAIATKPTLSYTVSFATGYDGGTAPASMDAPQTFAGYTYGSDTLIDADGNLTDKLTNNKEYIFEDKTLTAAWEHAAITLPSIGARPGYMFAGWFEPNSTIPVGMAGDEYTPTGSVTLEAHWERLITLVYRPGADDVINPDAMALVSDNVMLGKRFTPAANQFQRKGYHFVGWKTKAEQLDEESAKTYQPGALTFWLDVVKDGVEFVELEAQWEANALTQLTLDPSELSYTGAEQKPQTITVSGTKGGATETVDAGQYEISYDPASPIQAGEVTVTATPTNTGDYKASEPVTATYRIVKAGEFGVQVSAPAYTAPASDGDPYERTYDSTEQALKVVPTAAFESEPYKVGYSVVDADAAEAAVSSTNDGIGFTHAGTYTVYYHVVPQNYASFSGTFKVKVDKAAVTVKPDDAESMYGAPQASLTPTTVAGWAEGSQADSHVVSGRVYEGSSVALVLGAANAGEAISATTAAGTYEEAISGTGAQTGEYDDYEVTVQPATYVVKKAPLKVTANDDSIVYGDAAPTNGTVSYWGFANGDTAEDLRFVPTLSYVTGTAPDLVTYAPGSDAGTYDIVPGGLTEEGNYEYQYVSGTLTVEPRPLAFAWLNESDGSDLSYTYDGAEHSVHAIVDPASDVFAEDEVEVTAHAGNKATNAGEYVASVTGVGAKRGDADKSANYTLEGATNVSATWRIGKAGNSWTAGPDIGDWTYGETPATPMATPKFGRAADVKFEYKAKDAEDDAYSETVPSNAGAYTMRATLAEDQAGNWFGLTGTSDFTIKTADLTAKVGSTSIVYGDPCPSFTVADNVTFEGFVGQDDEGVVDSSGAAFNYDGYASGSDVGTYAIGLSGLSASNYLITYVPGTLTVSPRVAELAWTGGPTFSYDASPHGVSATVQNLVSGDQVTVEEYQDNEKTEAGSYTAKAMKLAGDKAGNYTLEGSATYDWSITNTQNEWQVGPRVANWKYGESPKSPEATAKNGTPSFQWRRKGDTGAWTDWASDDDAPTQAATYELRAVVEATASYLGLDTTVEFTVEQRAVTVSATNRTAQFGSTSIGAEGDLSHSVFGELAQGDSLVATLTTTASPTQPVGDYPISIDSVTVSHEGTDVTNNYGIQKVSGTYTITNAQVDVSATGYAGTYDGQAHGATVTVREPQGSEVWYAAEAITQDNFQTVEKFDSPTAAAVSAKNVTEQPLTVYWCVSHENYDLAGGSVQVQITPAALTVKAKNSEITYGEEPTAADPAVEYVGFVGGETADGLGFSPTISFGPAGNPYRQYDDAGSYDITASGLQTTNYAVTYEPGTLTVNRRVLSFEWANEKGGSELVYTYDKQAHAVYATAKDPVNGDDVRPGLYEANTATAADTYNAKVKTLEGTKAKNYVPSEESAPWTIELAENQWTVDPAIESWNYGERANVPSATPVYGADTMTFRYKPKGANNNEYRDWGESGPTEAGKYTLCVTVPGTNDYNGLTGTVDFEVRKAALKLAVTQADWTYDGKTHVAPAVSGNVGGGAVAFEYRPAGGAWSAQAPVRAGSWEVRATVAETANHRGGTATAAFTVAKADPRVGTVTADAMGCDTDPAHARLHGSAGMAAGTLRITDKALRFGTNSYRWEFAPADPANYQASSGTVRVTLSGHAWGAPTYSWSADLSACTATRTCRNDASHRETETVRATSSVTKAATPLSDGTRTFTATFANKAFATQTRSQTIKAYGSPSVAYTVHVQNDGWRRGTIRNGGVCGTTGRSIRMEAMALSLETTPYGGGIEYRIHVKDKGWLPYVRDGKVSGTVGESRRAEAVRIKLWGDMANHYDVWYRIHVQDLGWMAWATNGAMAGTEEESRRAEAVQVVLVPKGQGAPPRSYQGAVQTWNQASRSYGPRVKNPT